jgi:hypothetical protein
MMAVTKQRALFRKRNAADNWSWFDDQYLRNALAEDDSYDEVAKFLNRTVTEVKCRAFDLGCAKWMARKTVRDEFAEINAYENELRPAQHTKTKEYTDSELAELAKRFGWE